VNLLKVVKTCRADGGGGGGTFFNVVMGLGC